MNLSHDGESNNEDTMNMNMQVKEGIRIQKLMDKVNQVFMAADVNGDGVISYTEFLFAMAEGSSIFQELSTNMEQLIVAPSLVQQYSLMSHFQTVKQFRTFFPSFHHKQSQQQEEQSIGTMKTTREGMRRQVHLSYSYCLLFILIVC